MTTDRIRSRGGFGHEITEQLRHPFEDAAVFCDVVARAECARIDVAQQDALRGAQISTRSGSSIPIRGSLRMSGVPALGSPKTTTCSSASSMPAS